MTDLVSNVAVILGVLRNTRKLYELGRDGYRGDKEVHCLVEEIEAVEQSLSTVKKILNNCVGLGDTAGIEVGAIARLRDTLKSTQLRCEQARELLESKLRKTEKGVDEDDPPLRNKLSVGRQVPKIRKLCADLQAEREELARSLQFLDSHVLQKVQGDMVEINTQVALIPERTASETQTILQSDFADLKDFVTRAVQTAWKKAGRQMQFSRRQVTRASQISCPSETWSVLSSNASSVEADNEHLYSFGIDIQQSSSRLSCDFELSASFFPEQYTANSEVPKYLVAHYAIALPSSENTYSEWHIWWQDTARKYRMIRVTEAQAKSGQIKGQSISYLDGKWDPQYMWQSPTRLKLPCPFDQLQEYFLEQGEQEQDVMNLKIQVDQASDEKKLVPNDDKPYLPDDPYNSTLYRSAKYLIELKTLGCRVYKEHEVVTLQILSGFRAKVLVGGKIRAEKKLPLAPFHLTRWWYELKALHRLRGCEGITEFIGVEVDASGRQLQGFLRGLDHCDLSSVLGEAANDDRPITWARREKWAGQIINGIHEVHKRDLVVGTLDVNEIGVDDDDDARLLQISHGLCPVKCGCLAPEIRHRVGHIDPAERLDNRHMDARQDIFSLGLILWLIAQVDLGKGLTKDPRMTGRIVWWKRLFCQKFGCRYGDYELSDSLCQEQHVDPVDLPPCASTVPAYFREMISRCRATYPQHRATARELRHLFKRGTARSV